MRNLVGNEKVNSLQSVRIITGGATRLRTLLSSISAIEHNNDTIKAGSSSGPKRKKLLFK